MCIFIPNMQICSQLSITFTITLMKVPFQIKVSSKEAFYI